MGKQPKDFPVEHSQGWDYPGLTTSPSSTGSGSHHSPTLRDLYGICMGTPTWGVHRGGWDPPLVITPLPSLCLVLVPGL